MNLNTIELPDFIVLEWYKDKLIATLDSNWGEFALIKPGSSNIPSPHPAALPPSPIKPTPSSTPLPAVPSPALKYLGNNRRHITLLVQVPGSPFLPDDQLTFLTRILEACHMTLADVAIVNFAVTPVTITDIRQHLQPKTTLLFGLEPSALRLPINFPVFKPIDYDGCTHLSAPSLDLLVPNTEESKLLKSKLWVCLKTMFDV